MTSEERRPYVDLTGAVVLSGTAIASAILASFDKISTDIAENILFLCVGYVLSRIGRS